MGSATYEHLPRFSASGPALDGAAIERAEQELGMALPAPLRTLLLAANGGVPDRTHWHLAEFEDLEVASFLRLRDSRGKGRTLEQTRAFGVSRGWLPDDLIPFAIDHGGNFFALDPAGAVVFYTLDDWREERSTEENIQMARHWIAASLSDFVSGLRAVVASDAD